MAKKISASVGKGGKNKPHDSSGSVVLGDSTDDTAGNPPPSHALEFSAPASNNTEQVVVAFPIGDEFAYDPIEFGAATSLDYSLDIFAETVLGTSHVDITLAVLQGEFFVAPPNRSTPTVDGTAGEWTQLSYRGLEARDFRSVAGDASLPDFDEPFQFAYAFHADYSTTDLRVELKLDNMEATVNTVPEPTCGVMLVIVMAASVVWHRVWRKDEV